MTAHARQIARRDDSTGRGSPYRDHMRRWVPRPIDLAAAAVLTVATQVETWLLAHQGVPPGALAASFAVGTVAFAWHRVAPLAALTVGLTGLAVVPGVLGVDPANSFGWFVTAIALLVSAGYHARLPLLALATAFGLLAASIVLEKGWVLADILYVWLLAGGAWLAGRAVAGRTLRAELSEQRAVAAEQQAQWRAAAAVAEERLRIAREMHDVVSHSVSVMTLHVSGVRRLLRPDQTEERAALETVERTGRESLAEMHRMLGVLRGPEPADDSPAPGLGRLSELLDAARAGGLQGGLTVRGQVRPLPPGVDLAAYRIVQEAITNVLRHAAARRVDCTVDYGASLVDLRVVDDGSGPGSSGPGGHGLVGMRERAAAYGGTLEAGPRPDGGWAVHALLPVPPVEQPSPAPVAEQTR
jgi:signal transduction histidine kinase